MCNLAWSFMQFRVKVCFCSKTDFVETASGFGEGAPCLFSPGDIQGKFTNFAHKDVFVPTVSLQIQPELGKKIVYFPQHTSFPVINIPQPKFCP